MWATIVWRGTAARFACRGPRCKVHITSRTRLISTSDNNYQGEYTQNDFFVIFIPPQHKEGEITALGERRESQKTLPGAGSSIKFAVALRCCRTTGKKACEPFIWGNNSPEHSPHREIRSIVETNKGSRIKQHWKNIYEQSLKSSVSSPCLYLAPGSARRTFHRAQKTMWARVPG